MATDAQIETVARGIRDGLRPHMRHTADKLPDRVVGEMAQAAIAAYEATRPAVATDEATAWEQIGTAIDAAVEGRAVRERLGGEVVPDVTDAMVDAGVARWFDEREESISDGIRGVIAAALAEAGKDGQDG